LVLLFVTACGPLPGQNQPADTEPPAPVSNSGLVVGDGTTRAIRSDELNYQDALQTPASVRYTITAHPANGWIETSDQPGTAINGFTQEDVNTGRVSYHHERGRATDDQFGFEVSDGAGNVVSSQQFMIAVIPNVTALRVALSGNTSSLTWTNPANARFAETVIRRCEDGGYPESRTDCAPVSGGISGNAASEVVDIDTGIGPQTYYYAAFACDANGTCADGMRAGVYCDLGACVTIPELRDLNRIRALSDVETLRKTLIREIWGADQLPATLPTSVETVSDTRFTEASSIRQIVAPLPHGLTSTMRFYTPFSPNGRLVIYHEGHGTPPRDVEVIQRILRDGFHVLQISMPLYGYNYQADKSHDDLGGLDGAMRLFLEPVAIGLNYALAEQAFERVYMAGISGGGWTTVIYAALDTRIDASYPVAGSYPFFLREQIGGSTLGDFEQTSPDFYQNVSYIELYLMGAAGRRQIQIHNKFDPCCFAGTFANTYRDFVLGAAGAIGGSLDIRIDDTTVKHEISDQALGSILADMALP
jgi:hypothetical protein